MTGIYEIRHLSSGKRYVGSALNVHERWARHRWDLGGGRHGNAHLQAAWRKYGAPAFAFRVLARLEPEDLRSTESRLLALLVGRRDCYNIGTRAEAPMQGRSHRHESKEKVRIAKTGLTLSEETKAKIGAATRARIANPAYKERFRAALAKRPPVTDETRSKLSTAGKGRRLSVEHRSKIAAANRRRRLSPATRGKIARAHLGRKLPPEHVAKLVAIHTGSTHSPEHSAKIGAGIRAYHDRRRGFQIDDARIVQLRASGWSKSAIARELAITRFNVGETLARFAPWLAAYVNAEMPA